MSRTDEEKVSIEIVTTSDDEVMPPFQLPHHHKNKFLAGSLHRVGT